MKKVILTSLLAMTLNAFAQSPDLGKGISYSIETSGTLSDGRHAPFWLTANRYGLPSVERNSAYLRGGVFRSAENDAARRWDIGYGADLVIPANHTSHFFVQQLYADVRWKQPMQLKNNELSSGSQTLGINARPYPEIRLALPDYWDIPYTKGFLAFKGHIAFGAYTDNHFQKHFVEGRNPYDQNVLMHTKAGYIRIGKKDKPFTAEIGLEMASQFGGTHYDYTGSAYQKEKSSRNLKSFWHAFIGGGADSMDGAVQNNEGNMLGSWVARLNYDTPDAKFGLYADHFFEDHSSMFMLDYDGYGTGDEWDVRKDNRYFLYDLKDMMLGAELNLKGGSWLRDIVVEYLYTKYQSGPVYHDHTPNMSNHISGRDDYYNHNLYTGWQHWGMVMGNPLYRSPLYNRDGRIEVTNNRFVAWHLGVAGRPLAGLDYRLLATWQRGYGTYNMLFDDPETPVSLLAEATYRFADSSKLAGWAVKAAVGMDRGDIYGDNTGAQLTVVKTGLLNKKRK